jgi:hypothetical protein
MFPFPIATKQKCDIQQFYSTSTWNKPPGVSHVYMLLIGGGGNGDGSTTGGGSGAVTVWYGAAQNVPDMLYVSPGVNAVTNTVINYRGSNSAVVTLLIAATSAGTTGAATSSANYFTAMGFYTSIAGQNGETGAVSASNTTFLSGGGVNINVVANYGYKTTGSGYFQLQPIIVGLGGISSRVGGVGCGGGVTGTGGGNGFVLIASW